MKDITHIFEELGTLGGSFSRKEDLTGEREKLKELGAAIGGLEKLMPPEEHEPFSEFLGKLSQGLLLCGMPGYVESNGDILRESLELFSECMGELKREYRSKGKKCACCGQEVAYLPLSDYYTQMEEKYKVQTARPETCNRKEYSCPVCGAADRDRLIVSFLKKAGLREAAEGTRVLQVAPADAVNRWLVNYCPQLSYETTDLFMEGVTFQADIQDLSSVEDETYDLIICSHVLEHVRDDRRALRELCRILKADGLLVFLVPVNLDASEVDEEWGLSEEENWKRFGQGDHCRRYGKAGLMQRLEETGMKVHSLGRDYFGDEIFDTQGLSETSVLYVLAKSEETPFDKRDRKELPDMPPEDCPLVSVIMCVYNHEKYVAQAIESVLGQTYPNIEFIVADDGSEDSTPDIMRKYSKHFTKEYYFKENGVNRGGFLRLQTSGKYIAMMNSDDIWEKDKIALQVSYLEKNPSVKACFTWCSYTDEAMNEQPESIFYQRNRTKEEWLKLFWESGNCLCHPSILIEREAYIRLNDVGNACRQLPDFFMWVELVQYSEIYVMPRILVRMRRHTQNASAQNADNFVRYHVESASNWLPALRRMEDQVFLRTFCPQLPAEETSHSQVQCEKYFLMRNSPNDFMQTSAVYYFVEIDNDPEVRECFEKIYHYYGRKDFAADILGKGLGRAVRSGLSG